MLNLWGHFALSLIGFFLIIGGFVLRQTFPSIMQSKLQGKLVLSPDSETLENFISPPIPIYMEFNFFNVTNVDEFLNGAKPKVDEVGPYVYYEKKVKHDLNWTDITVDYIGRTTFKFEPRLSGHLKEEDLITTVNPLLVILAAKLSNPAVPFALHGLFEIFKQRFNMEPFITKPVGELLFKGYQEDLLLELYTYTGNEQFKTGRFGYFYPKNGTDGGQYSIFTGSDSIEKLQVINTWKGQPSLDYWNDEYCDMINGTTGSQFPQPIVPEKNMSLFSADLCRSLYLSFESKREFGGLTLMRYSLPYEVLSNRSENQCYCTDDFTCKASLVNLSPCRNGAPVIASTPHFYMGDDEVINAVDGLNPSAELHATYLDLEPNTGVAFKAAKRIQLSLPLRRYADLPELSKIKEVILPIFWLNEKAEVPLERAEALNEKLTKPGMYVNYAIYAIFAIGFFCILIPIVMFIVSKSKKGVLNRTPVEAGSEVASPDERENLN